MIVESIIAGISLIIINIISTFYHYKKGNYIYSIMGILCAFFLLFVLLILV
jgi:hypothetical protein